MPGFDKCRGCLPAAMVKREDRRQYLITKIEDRQRLSNFAEHEAVKSLRDEIGMARLLVEKRFNMIQTDADLMAGCAPINQLLLTIERLVKTCHSMEQSLGNLLSRAVVLQLGRKVCEVIIAELKDMPEYESRIDSLIEKLVPVLSNHASENHERITEVQNHQS